MDCECCGDRWNKVYDEAYFNSMSEVISYFDSIKGSIYGTICFPAFIHTIDGEITTITDSDVSGEIE